MKKQLLSVTLFVLALLLTASVSRGSEWLSTLQPLCFVADADCAPKKCGARSCGTIDRGCGLGTVACGDCAEDEACKDNICRRTPKCLCGGHWPNACQKCPPPGTEAIKPKPDQNDCACGPPFHRPCRICTPNELAAMASFCSSKGKNCGLIDNGHGGKADCGTCKGAETCGGGGVPNVCGQPQKK